MLALKTHLKTVAYAVALVLTLAGAMTHGLALPDDASTITAADTIITNRAEATYEDQFGIGFATVSPTISIKVLPVAALNVTPDETSPSATTAPMERINRIFQICNTGNTPDFYTITAADASAPAQVTALYFDTDASGTRTDSDTVIRLNETMSPRLAPGKCVNVLAVVDTKSIAPQSTLALHLTARSNVVTTASSQMAQNDGTIINIVGEGARLTAPDNAQLPPAKLIENKDRAIASAGQSLTYTIAFRNHGDVAARRIRVTDDLPANLQYVAGSLRLGARSLTAADDTDEGTASARHIEIHLNEVAVNELVQISFKAQLIGDVPSGTGIVNEAIISGENISDTKSSPAIAVVDPFGTVYAGHSKGTVRIGGARVAILADQTSDATLALPQGAGFTPNEANDNPFLTDAQGHFAFALAPEQLGTTTQSALYRIGVTAPNYRARLLEISLRPSTAAAGLFEATVRALDNQPIARGGSFETTTENVLLENIASVALNVPMFENSVLEITKTADKPRAEIGDIVSYRVEVHNASAAPVSGVRVSDQLPTSFHYADNTARLQIGSASATNVEPEVAGNSLAFNIGNLGGGERATIIYRVRIGANARDGEQINSAIASGTFLSGEQITTAPARASVIVGRGVFSTRQVIIGHVFEDANGNGLFDAGDHAVAGARVYLNNGQSVITDSAGQYNIPSAGDGSLVLSIDPVTIPQGLALANDNRRADRSWTRLLRTPLGGGALLRQNFALVPSTDRNASARALQHQNALTGETDKETKTAPSSAPSLPTPTTNAVSAGDATVSDQLPRTNNAQLASGTYEIASTERLQPVAPGDVLIVSPGADEVVMTPALSLEARVHESWTVLAEVNGERISDSNIGVSRVDHKNEVSTYGFVGISLRPGPNRIKVAAVNSSGAVERTVEQIVYGRGPAKRLEIVTDKTSVQAGGRDSTTVRVRAFDEWGHPAADGPIAVETSAGRLIKPTPNASDVHTQHINATANTNKGTLSSVIASPEQSNENAKQQIVSLSGGEAVLQLFAENASDAAKLHAAAGEADAHTEIRFTPEVRPAILVGLAEMSIGRAAPEISERGGDDANVHSRLAFFYRGPLFSNKNLLTLAYDSARSLNRTAGHDRIFQLDPLDRAYPLFGDSSTRFEDAQSNSKLYARLDRNRSYALFGDFDAGMDNLSLTNYARKLTGVKLHVENAHGDFITATGARPDTAFARDVVPGGSLSLVRLSNSDILPGSETIVLEVRDRRNPEIILSRETLIRSVDYNLDPTSGQVFFMRPISTFDYQLNLVQIVATYEHRANNMTSGVYTVRAQKRFDGLGLRLGLSGIEQREGEFGSFMLGGIDGEKTLPRNGHLKFELAMSRGRIAGGGNNVFAQGGAADEHNGNAFRADLEQPLGFYGATLRANFSRSDANYINPFGATVAPGAERAAVSIDLKPRASRTLHLGLLDERNHTTNVNNNRVTASFGWNETWRTNFRTFFGYDYRKLNDNLSAKETTSNLVTVGAEYKPIEKLELSVKREQNIGDADPTYPTQTTFAARYQLNQLTRLFLTERLSSAAIKPIADVAATGFASTNSRRETAIGIETRIWQHTALNGRYQLENGINGTDSFAVIGLQNNLPVTKGLSLDLGYEHGFHLAGDGTNFNNATIGFSWQPLENFRSSARYELRDRNGFGQAVTLGAAGKLTDGITALARVQWSRASLLGGRSSSSFNGTAALAVRPLESDRAALLFSYTRRSLSQDADAHTLATRDRADTLSSDGLFQATKNLELYGRFALKFSANGDNTLAYTSALTYLMQARAQERLGRYLDFAGEIRLLAQPSSGTRRTSYGTELGFWAMPDLRLGVGYNFTDASEPQGSAILGAHRGFYFNISSKLSNLFNLFGTSQEGLAAGGTDTQDNEGKKP